VLVNLRYQGELPHQLARAVEKAGGAARLRACGHAYTAPFLVPAVAWRLHVHMEQVDLEPERPAVVFRVHTNPGEHAQPSLMTLGDTPLQTLAVTHDWRILTACR
jgi:hypothetical protein